MFVFLSELIFFASHYYEAHFCPLPQPQICLFDHTRVIILVSLFRSI